MADRRRHRLVYPPLPTQFFNAALYRSRAGRVDGWGRINGGCLQNVARKNKVVLVDVADKIPADGTHYNDSVHFREADSREMAKYVFLKILNPVGKLVTTQK